MSYQSRNPQNASEVLDDIAATTPSNPIASKHKVINRNGHLKVKDSAGKERLVDMLTNYIVGNSGSFGWATSDAAKLTVTTDTTAGELPRNSTTASGIKIQSVASADSTNAYVYYDFTLDDVDLNGRVMSIKWDQKPLAVAPAATDLVVNIVDAATHATVLATPFTTAIPVTEGTFQTYFITPSTAAVSLRISTPNNMSDNAGIVISDIVVGPNVQVQGSAIGAWKAYTPTGTFNTNTNYSGFIRPVGENVELRVQVNFTGSPNAASFLPTPAQLLNGTGYTINNSRLTTATLALVSVGTWAGFDSGVNTAFGGTVSYDGSNFYFNYSTGTSTAVSVTNAQPVAWGNLDAITAIISVPVNELSSNVTLANRAVEEYAADDGSAAVFGPNGALVPNQAVGTAVSRVFTLPSTAQQTDFTVLEFKVVSGNWQLAADVFPFTQQGSKDYGMRGYWISTTQYTVTFGAGGLYSDSATYAQNSAAPWSGQFSSGARFRLRKVSSGASVGFPINVSNVITTAGTNQFYEEFDSTGTPSGGGSTGSYVVHAVRNGTTVTATTKFVVSGTGISNAISISSILPTRFRPVTGAPQILTGLFGNNIVVTYTISTSGTVEMYRQLITDQSLQTFAAGTYVSTLSYSTGA